MPLRVLAIAQAAEPGGAELALLRLVPALAAQDVALALAVPREGGVAAAARSRGLEVRELPIGALREGGWPRAVAAWPRAHWVARRTRAKAVWLNGIVPQRLVPALPVPAVLHLHDLLERRPAAWERESFWRHVPAVACASQAVARAALAAGAPSERVHTIDTPVEVAAAAPRPTWADGRPVVGFVGRIEPRKGVLDLLAAARDLRARQPELRVVIVAGPALEPDRDYEHRVVAEAEELGDTVVMVGPVPDASALMHWFDVLCVPSHAEPFGTVAAEALATGTPAVVTDSGGMSEYVLPDRNGAVVPPGDPQALAAALERVLPRAGEMADAAREAVARFATERVAADLARLLHAAARGGRADGDR